MSNINLSTLGGGSYGENTHKYKDIALDVEVETNVLSRGLFRSSNVTDIKDSKDEAAIQNSILNIFNTNPGEKLLDPEFGLALKRYLFDPLSEDIAQNIGQLIMDSLARYEPRITVTSVSVIPDFDQNQYIIALYITIPVLNISNARYNGELNTEGFTFKITNT